MFKTFTLLFAVVVLALQLQAQGTYKLPPKEVVDLVNAPATPLVSLSPTKDAIILTEPEANPTMALLAQPYYRIAGLRINPTLNAIQRLREYKSMTIQFLKDNKRVPVQQPANGKIGIATWSDDGKKIAFTVDVAKGVQLWVADAATGKSHQVGTFMLNDIFGGYEWMNDSRQILVKMIPANRGPQPQYSLVPTGPVISETTTGRKAKARTYEDLLKSEEDANIFEYLAKSQLAEVDITTGAIKKLGTPAIYDDARFSPNEAYLLIHRIKRPFSLTVPYELFAQSYEVWNKEGNLVKTVVENGILDDIPTMGVATGPRSIIWQRLYPARLLWAEALDGGDPLKKAPFRDKLMLLDQPFTGVAHELLQTQFRYRGMEFMPTKDVVLISESDRDRNWRTTWMLNLTTPQDKKKIVDISQNDDYKNPGRLVQTRTATGEIVVLTDGDNVFYNNAGASPKGSYPSLDKVNLKTMDKAILFKAKENTFEQFISFTNDKLDQILTSYESSSEVPNYFLMDLKTGTKTAVTTFKDPQPSIRGMKKQLVTYKRKDGVALSGTLYLPANYKQGERLPLFIWAYPLEYTDAATAGQVRGSANRFTVLRGVSPLFMATQGYAVLMDATMPVVGPVETMNDTFVEQVVASGRAAIDYLDSLGVIDRKKVVVSGHSYGAFMTANLLAHSSDYAAGVARSGAYNRLLTPFGFQSERRSFWDAPEMYLKVSPFAYADKIKTPLLMIHGQADNNDGTFPIQSERLFDAIKGNGGTAKLVLLPLESHGYSGLESILHVLAEMIDWSNKYARDKK
jgi:dipeptidyl aminopeptidase/acylaminoacyl peptidase